jgi:hypothetical protein
MKQGHHRIVYNQTFLKTKISGFLFLLAVFFNGFQCKSIREQYVCIYYSIGFTQGIIGKL